MSSTDTVNRLLHIYPWKDAVFTIQTGSNLRKYHAEWKNSDSHENFFYWLDYGGGKNISLESCPRERLDWEQVRYLSREERMNYLVMVDEEGRLCWKRNGIPIDTTTEWRDSVNGIVPVEDEAPEFSPKDSTRPDDSSSGASSNENSAKDRPDGANGDSANEDLKGVRRFKKSKQVGPAAMFEHLLMKPTKKKSKWIFVSLYDCLFLNCLSTSIPTPCADRVSWNAGCRYI